MKTGTRLITDVAAGVPFVAVPPAGGTRPSAPVVLAWHLLDPPRTERAFQAALPLDGLDAWRIYLGLPMTGSRTPAGGTEELTRLASKDVVLRIHGPVIEQAAAELAPAFEALTSRFDLAGPVAVVGGSIGAAVAQLVMAEGTLEVAAAVLISPVVQLRPMVDSLARRLGVTYSWSPPTAAIAENLDFVARAREIVERGQPAVLLVVGEDDDGPGIQEPAQRLQSALADSYADSTRVQLITVPRMGHALADEPGINPAPQTPAAALVDKHATRWLQRHLVPGTRHL